MCQADLADMTLSELLRSPSVVSRVCVARSLVFCVMFCISLFVPFLIVFSKLFK